MKTITYKCDGCGDPVEANSRNVNELHTMMLGKVEYDLCLSCSSVLRVLMREHKFKKTFQALTAEEKTQST